MVSVGNNFFYTKSLPCSLWFFDKGKDVERLDKVLFIDARNYYTVVDRTLNEWTDWQLKNLNAIVWLYRGETEKYRALMEEYEQAIRESWDEAIEYAQDLCDELPDAQARVFRPEIERAKEQVFSRERFEKDLTIVSAFRKASDGSEGSALKAGDAMSKEQRAELAKAHGYRAYKEYEKRMEMQAALAAQKIEDCGAILKEAVWLFEKFGEGTYRDIPGLCKITYTTKEAQGDDKDGVNIEEKGWSLTPGAYVGVAPVEDDGVDFKQRMAEIRAELLTLQAQSNELMETISRNMEELGI